MSGHYLAISTPIKIVRETALRYLSLSFSSFFFFDLYVHPMGKKLGFKIFKKLAFQGLSLLLRLLYPGVSGIENKHGER